MDNRYGSWLLPMAALLFPLAAMAQIPSEKQSHRELPGGLDMSNPQEMMAERLHELHELHGLQDQVQGLLKDQGFLNNLKHLSEPELRQLRERMLKGEGLGQDRNWNQLLQQAKSSQKLDQRQIDILRRWAERADPNKLPAANLRLLNGVNPLPTPFSESNTSGETALSAAMAKPQSSWFDRMQEESTKWFFDHFDDVGGDVLDALLELQGKDENAPLAEMLRTLRQADFSALTDEQVTELSQHLPNVGEMLREQHGVWDEVRSIFREAPSPSLPNLAVSKPTSAATDGDGWMPLLLSLPMLAAMVLLLCRRSARLRARAGVGEGDEWRLGSWPVSPSRVSTRHDIVISFEYLALLLLGVVAGTCHHRALAERLAAQDGDNPARRQAAEMLAWLYEQARYAPPGETLSKEELTDARHALCLLAGVTTP